MKLNYIIIIFIFLTSNLFAQQARMPSKKVELIYIACIESYLTSNINVTIDDSDEELYSHLTFQSMERNVLDKKLGSARKITLKEDGIFYDSDIGSINFREYGEGEHTVRLTNGNVTYSVKFKNIFPFQPSKKHNNSYNSSSSLVKVSKCVRNNGGIFACFRFTNYNYNRKILQMQLENDFNSNCCWRDIGRIIEDFICFKKEKYIEPQKIKLRIFNGPELGTFELNPSY